MARESGHEKRSPHAGDSFLDVVHDEPSQYEKAGHFLEITTWFLPSQEM